MSARVQRRHEPGRGQAGFTIIEVMVAMIVFAIGCLGLAMCIPLGVGRVSKAGQQTRSSQLASFKAEELLTAPYDTSPLLTAGSHSDAANPYDGAYFLSWAVEDSVPIANCKRITVTTSRDAVGNPPISTLVIVKPQL